MKKFKKYLTAPILCLLLITIIQSFKSPDLNIEKPDVFAFGETKEDILKRMKGKCTSITEQNITPIQLPTAKSSQVQLDCEGFLFAGKKRKVELVFADNILDMVWVLTDANEEEYFIESYGKIYGKPTHKIEGATFFLNNGVGIRNEPHEVLFISDRLKEPYNQWLSQ